MIRRPLTSPWLTPRHYFIVLSQDGDPSHHATPLFHCSFSGWRPLTSPWLTPHHYFIVLFQDGDPSHHPGSHHAIISLFSLRMGTPHITLAHTTPLFHCSLSGWRPLTSPWLTPRHYFIVLSQDGDPSQHPGSRHAIISLFSLRMETPHITLTHSTPLFHCSLSGRRPLTSPWLTPRHYFIVLSQNGDPSHHPGSRHAIISLFSLRMENFIVLSQDGDPSHHPASRHTIISLFSLRMETPHITLAHATPLFHCSLSGWRPLTSPWLTPRHYFIVLSQDGEFHCSLSGWRPLTSPCLTPHHYFIVLSQDGDPSHHPGSRHYFIVLSQDGDPSHHPGSRHAIISLFSLMIRRPLTSPWLTPRHYFIVLSQDGDPSHHATPLFHCSFSGWRPLTSPWLTPHHYFIVLFQDGDPSHHPGSHHAIISLFSLRMGTPHITLAHTTPLFHCSLSGWRPLTSPWLTPRHYFIVLSQDGDPSQHPGSRHAIISLFSLRMETPHITLTHSTPLFHCSLSGWRPLTSPWLTPRHYFIVLSHDPETPHITLAHTTPLFHCSLSGWRPLTSRHTIISLFFLRMETPHITLAHATPLFHCSLSGWGPLTSPWLTPRHYFIVLSQDGDPSHHPGSHHAIISLFSLRMETPHITLAHSTPLFHCSLSGWRPLTTPWLTPRHYFIVLSQDGDPSHHPDSLHAIISLFSLRMETPHITLAHAKPLFHCSLSGWGPLTSPWLTPRHYFIVLSQDGDPSHHPASRHTIISLFSFRMGTPHITLAHTTPLFHCSLSGWGPLTSPWLTPRHYFIVLSQDGDPSKD